MILFSDFQKQIYEGIAQDYLVRIRLKYDHEKEWHEINELLLFDPEIPDMYGWYNDWNEGESFQIVGYIALNDIKIDEMVTTGNNPGAQ